MQHCGGTKYRLTDVAKASKESKAGIEWLQKLKPISYLGTIKLICFEECRI
jgi:hypothetical protein